MDLSKQDLQKQEPAGSELRASDAERDRIADILHDALAVGRRIHAYAIFGSVEIDLSEALFDHQQVVVKSFAIFGSVDIRVPENVSLRGTGGGVLGSFEVATLDSGEPQAPIVYVDGWAVLGSVEARPKRGKVVADILDRVHRKVDRSLRKHLGH